MPVTQTDGRFLPSSAKKLAKQICCIRHPASSSSSQGEMLRRGGHCPRHKWTSSATVHWRGQRGWRMSLDLSRDPFTPSSSRLKDSPWWAMWVKHRLIRYLNPLEPERCKRNIKKKHRHSFQCPVLGGSNWSASLPQQETFAPPRGITLGMWSTPSLGRHCPSSSRCAEPRDPHTQTCPGKGPSPLPDSPVQPCFQLVYTHACLLLTRSHLCTHLLTPYTLLPAHALTHSLHPHI